MEKKQAKYSKPLLWGLFILGGIGFYYANVTEGHYKIYNRSLALLIAVGPAALYSLSGRGVKGLVRVSIAAALMTYFVISGRIDLDAMYNCLDKWPWLLAGIALIATQPVAGFLRWKWLLDVQDIVVSYSRCFSLTMSAFFFNTCLPGATGGDLFKAYAISKESEKTASAVTTIILDRFTGLGGLLVVCAAAFLFNLSFITSNPGIKEVAVLMVAIFICSVFLFSAVMSSAVMNLLKKLPMARWSFPGRSGMVNAYKAVHLYRGSKMVLFLAMLVSVLSHLATIGGAVCFAKALGITGLSFTNYLLIVPMGLAFNAIPITPGGVGQGQAAFDYLFERALPGVAGAGPLGAAMMTFVHIAMILISMAGGVCYALGYHELHDAVEKAEEEAVSE
ncbi:MAG: lysylphosphatidylglycerol synthase transmembrane domain-containing protein [Planctomycetota bacterium]|jgi:uncharacterized protein (TIRG00374 family)